MADVADLLRHLMEVRASDLHIKAGSVPFLRINGRLHPSALPVMKPAETEELANSILPADRAEEFRKTGETDFALGVSGVGRFRVSVMRQRGSAGLVFRRVLTSPPSFEVLGLPAPVRQLAERRRGLVLVTGPADSGKSTTVASMINHINEHAPASIITIEDPIEMLHADKKAFISQREIGTDSQNHLIALRRSLRHDPDVIYVDAINDVDLMATVLGAATGRLVISTLPSINTVETIRRIVDFFPPHQSRQIRHTLASALQGVISQRLIDRDDGKGRVAAFEVMISTPRVHDAIVEAPGAQEVEALIETGEYYGMRTMDQSLAELHRAKIIAMREALASAIHPQELRVQLQGSNQP